MTRPVLESLASLHRTLYRLQTWTLSRDAGELLKSIDRWKLSWHFSYSKTNRKKSLDSAHAREL